MGWSLAIKSFGTEGFHIPSWVLQAAGAQRPVQQKYAAFFPLSFSSAGTSGAAAVLNQLESLVTLHSGVIVESYNWLQVECVAFVWAVCLWGFVKDGPGYRGKEALL